MVCEIIIKSWSCKSENIVFENAKTTLAPKIYVELVNSKITYTKREFSYATVHFWLQFENKF